MLFILKLPVQLHQNLSCKFPNSSLQVYFVKDKNLMLDRLLVDSNTTIHIWPFEQYFPSVDKFNFYFLDHIWIENQKYCPKHILHIAERTSIGQSIIFSCFLYFWKTLIWPSYLVHGFGFTRLSLINLKNFYALPPQAQKEHFNLHCCRQVQSLLIPSTLLAATMMANPSVASSCVAPLFSPLQNWMLNPSY